MVNTAYPSILIIDKRRLQQVLLNVLSNAIKFQSVGVIDINVKLKRYKSKPSEMKLEISVEDHGIGMSEEEIKNVFKPFQQSTNKMTLWPRPHALGMAGTSKVLGNFFQSSNLIIL